MCLLKGPVCSLVANKSYRKYMYDDGDSVLNDTVSGWHYLASKSMPSWKRLCKEAVVAYLIFKKYPAIRLQVLTITMKNLCQDNRCPSKDTSRLYLNNKLTSSL
jgi:hypothetical protein